MKDALDVLRELVVATKALRHETVGGVFPEVSRQVKDDTRIRFEEALEDASEFLNGSRPAP